MTTVKTSSRIGLLQELVQSLNEHQQQLFARIFRVDTATGELDPPETMQDWIVQHFGSVEAVRRQRIVKVTNLITLEGSLFNPLRARRPIDPGLANDVETTVRAAVGDPFCSPLERTPEDTFGRIRGTHSITASNVAKADGLHGLVIFHEHHPLHFSADAVKDYIDTALRWAQAAHSTDLEARYFFFLWNCLWRSGASVLHGHAQVTLSKGIHYAPIEHQRRVALLYRVAHGRDYFTDLFAVHEALGLGVEHDGVRVVAYLTPRKEKEVLLMAPVLDDHLKRACYGALRCLVDELGVTSFNLALWLRPIDSVVEDWTGFPAMVRIVDRGDLRSRTADVGAMELYANCVVASDPFALAQALKTYLSPSGS